MRRDLPADAAVLRALHGGPLVLANVWDAATARLVEELGFPALATSSAAVAEARGLPDADTLGADAAFEAVRVVAAAVSVPVTADIEAGYGLAADELVDRLLEAGAVGCNLEDTDHHGSDVLVPAETHAARVAEVKEAGRRAGVDVVVNARVDVYLREVDDAVEEAIRRGRLYREAGADCVYPIFVSEPADIRRLVAEIGTINVMLRPGAPSVAELRALGVARVSLGSGLFRESLRAVREAAAALL